MHQRSKPSIKFNIRMGVGSSLVGLQDNNGPFIWNKKIRYGPYFRPMDKRIQVQFYTYKNHTVLARSNSDLTNLIGSYLSSSLRWEILFDFVS